jgi:hypothetical protein
LCGINIERHLFQQWLNQLKAKLQEVEQSENDEKKHTQSTRRYPDQKRRKNKGDVNDE